MSLVELWQTSPSQLRDKHVQQIIAFAGAGRLQDGNEASIDFRAFLSHVPSEVLTRYANECLAGKFDDGGFALQDVINQVGRRLGFEAEDGRYRGVAGHSGHDGLWLAHDRAIIVEVKTTDTYRIDLDRIADYRLQIVRLGRVPDRTMSILLVVGRQDTGDLEAQIRGSRHAWDIRVISVDGLIRLMTLKETIDDPQILKKTLGILTPREFTRVDDIIDLVFSTAEEAIQEATTEEEAGRALEDSRSETSITRVAPANFYDACIQRVAAKLGCSLVKQSRTYYASPDGSIAVLCVVSRAYEHQTRQGFWYAFHPHQREKLAAASQSFVALGCGSPNVVLFIPSQDFTSWVDDMNVTRLDDRLYWHVQIVLDGRRFELRRKAGTSRVDLTRYLLD